MSTLYYVLITSYYNQIPDATIGLYSFSQTSPQIVGLYYKTLCDSTCIHNIIVYC